MTQARNMMPEHVITVGLETSVREIATLLLEQHISAVPVVEESGVIFGVVSEGDLIHRSELGTEVRGRSWWLRLFEDTSAVAERYSKSYGAKARDVMTRDGIVGRANIVRALAASPQAQPEPTSADNTEIRLMGDGMLAEFPRVVDTVQTA